MILPEYKQVIQDTLVRLNEEYNKVDIRKLEEQRKRRNEYLRKRYKQRRHIPRTPAERINDNIRSVIRQSLNNKKAGRKWETLVGYTVDDLIKHLEILFDGKMTWDNYGKYEEGKYKWHIDHIKPISLFHYKDTNDREFKECWALSNLQPLEVIANISKGNRY